jgi:hypothetical protein
MLTKQACTLPCCVYAACCCNLYLELSVLAAANAESEGEKKEDKDNKEASVPVPKLKAKNDWESGSESKSPMCQGRIVVNFWGDIAEGTLARRYSKLST